MDASPLWSQEEYDEPLEFARAVRLSLLGVSPSREGSFRSGAVTLEKNWSQWCAVTFGEIIGPVFRDSCQLAAEFKLREIAALDHILGEKLGTLSHGLILASQPFIEGKENMKGNREWQKYILKREAGEAPGHLPIIFALHSVLFRLPMTCSLQAYAWLEWKTGHLAIGKMSQAGYPEDPPAIFLEVKKHIVRVINSKSSEGNQSGLRVV